MSNMYDEDLYEPDALDQQRADAVELQAEIDAETKSPFPPYDGGFVGPIDYYM